MRAQLGEKSLHSKKPDLSFNNSCRDITGCLKPMSVGSLHVLSGIAPPDILWAVASRMERLRQNQDRRHLCHDTEPAQKRSKSKKSFLHSVQPLTEPPHAARCRLWEKRRNINHHHDKLHLPHQRAIAPRLHSRLGDMEAPKSTLNRDWLKQSPYAKVGLH